MSEQSKHENNGNNDKSRNNRETNKHACGEA